MLAGLFILAEDGLHVAHEELIGLAGDHILIEDAGIGSALIQELKFTPYNVVGVRPVNDKLTRAQIVAAKFESGKVFLPLSAPWLPELEAELYAFPQSRHDDQIDSISQALSEEISSYDPGALVEGLARIFSPQVRWHVTY